MQHISQLVGVHTLVRALTKYACTSLFRTVTRRTWRLSRSPSSASVPASYRTRTTASRRATRTSVPWASRRWEPSATTSVTASTRSCTCSPTRRRPWSKPRCGNVTSPADSVHFVSNYCLSVCNVTVSSTIPPPSPPHPYQVLCNSVISVVVVFVWGRRN